MLSWRARGTLYLFFVSLQVVGSRMPIYMYLNILIILQHKVSKRRGGKSKKWKLYNDTNYFCVDVKHLELRMKYLIERALDCCFCFNGGSRGAPVLPQSRWKERANGAEGAVADRCNKWRRLPEIPDRAMDPVLLYHGWSSTAKPLSHTNDWVLESARLTIDSVPALV